MTDFLRQFRLLKILLLAISLLVFANTSTSLAQESDGNNVDTDIIFTQDAVIPGQEFTLLIEQSIVEHWHTYWRNPGDSGTPPNFDFEMPEGFEQIGEIISPSPKKIPYGPLVNFGHEGTTYYQVAFKAPNNLEIGQDVPITLNAEWLVCDDICIPEYEVVERSIPVAETATLTNENYLNEAIKQSPSDKGWPSEEPLFYKADDQTFTLMLGDIPSDIALEQGQVFFFPYEWGVIRNDVPQTLKIDEDYRVANLEITRDTRDLSELGDIKGVIKINDAYQYITLKKVENFGLSGTFSGSAPIKEEAGNTSLGFALLLAFFGGLILNLMPCVFPVLSMKALSLVKLQDKAPGHGIKHGLSYTFGVLLSFAAIAGLLIILQNTGAQIGWGFQLQNPIITGFFAYLLFVIGLNLSGFFEITLGFSGVGENLTRGNDSKASFFTGILATLVATPCTAPFMATALGYALVQPPAIAMSVFLMLGFGLAFPYLILTITPSLQKALPKPGLWMETFRQFLSFPMFISALWLTWVFAQQTSVMAFASLMLGMIAISFGIWLLKHFPKEKPILQLISIFIVLGSFLWASFIPLSKNLVVNDMGIKKEQIADKDIIYQAFTPEKLSQALESNQAVFVNMTADWCITCKVNERIALSSKKFKRALDDNDIVYLKGDWTNQDSEITKFLKSYGRNGVPIYVFYQRPDENGERPEPVVLPQILTEGAVLKAFEG